MAGLVRCPDRGAGHKLWKLALVVVATVVGAPRRETFITHSNECGRAYRSLHAVGIESCAFGQGLVRWPLALSSWQQAGSLTRRHAARRAPIIRRVPKAQKDLPPVAVPQEAMDDEYKYGNYKFPYGWNNDEGRFIDMPPPTTKWWQRPGYLTPDGYQYPPHWNMETYQLCIKETAYAKLEAQFIKDLEKDGFTWRDIRDRATMYEIVEDQENPMTDKMKFLLQVQALWMGVDEDLLDFRETPAPPPRKAKKVNPGNEPESA
mmetsp:Transcript_35588/g.80320  ORF Transcript_35588/g.80320 Transcript_35588/m.80320 type:complete len:262 (-) Transcript_35588:32-817(-)